MAGNTDMQALNEGLSSPLCLRRPAKWLPVQTKRSIVIRSVVERGVLITAQHVLPGGDAGTAQC